MTYVETPISPALLVALHLPLHRDLPPLPVHGELDALRQTCLPQLRTMKRTFTKTFPDHGGPGVDVVKTFIVQADQFRSSITQLDDGQLVQSVPIVASKADEWCRLFAKQGFKEVP